MCFLTSFSLDRGVIYGVLSVPLVTSSVYMLPDVLNKQIVELG